MLLIVFKLSAWQACISNLIPFQFCDISVLELQLKFE